MPGWIRHCLSTSALATGAILGLYAAGPALGAGPVREIQVQAEPVPLSKADPAADRVGRLRFVGGLVLKSPDDRFGGISDLQWEGQCNRLLGVTDTGSWLILEPQEEGERLTGVKVAWLAPLLDSKGAPPATKTEADAEGLARMPDGVHWVFYEQRHRAERYAGVSACNPDSLATAASAVRTFEPTGGWPPNGGMEAVGALGHSLVAISESVPAKDGGRLGFQQEGDNPARLFTWVTPAGHEPTAMAIVEGQAGGTQMLVLHRRFSPLTGVSAILSEAWVNGPADRVEGREVAKLAPPLTVDNMEGIAARTESGRQYIYLISDNNFNSLQRTILMKFEILPAQ